MSILNVTKYTLLFSILSIICLWQWSARAGDPGVNSRENYFKLAVEGDVPPRAQTNEVLRDSGVTNAFDLADSKGYHLSSSFQTESKGPTKMVVRTLEYAAMNGDLSERFRVSVSESNSGSDEAMNALAYLMSSSSTMGGIRFKQFKQGPGDICFVNRGAHTDGVERDINVVFFCRDNIAVMVMPYSSQSNILPFSRLLDSSLLTLPIRTRLPVK